MVDNILEEEFVDPGELQEEVKDPVYVYNYDGNGVFTVEEIADESPLEPGIYLLPANATFTKPPDPQQYKTYVWDTEKEEWEIKDDYRQAILYDKRNGEIDTSVELQLGETPDFNRYSLTEVTELNPFAGMTTEEKRAALIELGKQTRNSIEFNDTLEAAGAVWQVDNLSRERIKDAIYEMETQNVPDEATIPWILADDSVKNATKADLQSVLSAFNMRRQQVFLKYAQWISSGSMQPFNPDM